MASKYHRRLGFRSTAGQSSGGEDASWVEAKAALKTLTPLSRVHLTLEDTRGAGADGELGAQQLHRVCCGRSTLSRGQNVRLFRLR